MKLCSYNFTISRVRTVIDPWIISDWAPNFGPAEWWNRKTKNELRLYYKEGHLTKIEHFYWGFDTGNLHQTLENLELPCLSLQLSMF